MKPGTSILALYFLAAVFSSSWHNCILAQDTNAQLVQSEEVAFGRAVEIAAKCVVQIETFGGLERVGEELIAEGPTTGTIVSSDGWIVSSLYSFRQQPASILVVLPNGKRAAAKVVARDHSRELALLKVDVDVDLPVAVPAAIAPEVGHWTIALGKTYDASQVSQSVGVISALGRAYGKAIQTDAKVSPINYGGPLIDLEGKVLGILAPISPGTFFDGDSSELYDSGVGFAIPLKDILDRLSRMQSGEDIYPGKLGVVSTNQNEMAGPVRLTGSAPGSPAAKVGLKAGDVIVQAGGQRVFLLAELRHALAQVDAGQTLELAVERKGQRIEVQCELAKDIPVYRRRYLGLRLEGTDSGLVIKGVESDSPAQAAGLKTGDRIVACNSETVKSIQELEGHIAVAELEQVLKLTLIRGESEELTLDLNATTWPTELPSSMPPATALEPKVVVDVIDVTLGDVPNKAYAIIPPAANQRPHGLLIVFPEPGQLDREKSKTFWEKFCLEQNWMVVVMNSANPQAWSMEEVELAGRVIGRMDKAYRLDESRCVLSGFGVGGRLALAAASMERKRVKGVLTLGTDLGKLSLRQRNAPLQSLDFLLVGDLKKLDGAAKTLSEFGYAANVVAAEDLKPGAWETVPLEPVSLWLEGLGRL
jgi:serine protease Do